jgi:hypothetical protein
MIGDTLLDIRCVPTMSRIDCLEPPVKSKNKAGWDNRCPHTHYFNEMGKSLNQTKLKTQTWKKGLPISIVTQVTELLQGLLEESMDIPARDTGCVKQERKFSGSALLATLVLTMSRNPIPKHRVRSANHIFKLFGEFVKLRPTRLWSEADGEYATRWGTGAALAGNAAKTGEQQAFHPVVLSPWFCSSRVFGLS